VNKAVHLYSLNVGKNLLSGMLPEQLGGVSSLIYLKLYYNHFNSTLPLALGSLARLQILQVQGNAAITGDIPSTLCSRQQPMSIDVTGTEITCYSGCLTSSNVVIQGANDFCPNGTLTTIFLNQVGGFLCLCLIAFLWQALGMSDLIEPYYCCSCNISDAISNL
jgi:hypothetical protein